MTTLSVCDDNQTIDQIWIFHMCKCPIHVIKMHRSQSCQTHLCSCSLAINILILLCLRLEKLDKNRGK